MNASAVRAFLFSFQTKLFLALTAVIVLTIFVAGTVFVVRERDQRREQALDRVAAASPAIYEETFFALVSSQRFERSFSEILDGLAAEQDVRILLVASDGRVLFDTADRLGGARVEVPRSTVGDFHRGFVAWEPPPEFPEQDLTLISASTGRPGLEAVSPFRVVLAVETETLASAWLGILPGLSLAALVAVPLSALAAVVLARQVAHPVRRLTEATEALAGGDFNQRVEIGRDDEIGRLARAFSLMTERIGERDAQMRALLANVSHDLKTPMTSITGYAQSLADGTAQPEDTGRIAGIIRDEAEHVNRLLADLLYLGELDAGQVVNRAGDAPLGAIVERCARRIEPLARERGIAVEASVPRDLVARGVDAEKLERAITNVFDNAAKFTPPGGRIAASARRTDGAAPEVRLRVWNSETSIPADDLPRIFDRFYRGDRTRRTSGGSGLGLAIARELVELNGGRLSASNEDDGVAFTFALPA